MGLAIYNVPCQRYGLAVSLIKKRSVSSLFKIATVSNLFCINFKNNDHRCLNDISVTRYFSTKLLEGIART